MPTLAEWIKCTDSNGKALDPIKCQQYLDLIETRNVKKPTVPPPMTPIVIRGWNFAAAMARWTLAGLPRRTQAEIDERLSICQACEFLQNHHCRKCGCNCNEQNSLLNKLALSTEKCPEGKWK